MHWVKRPDWARSRCCLWRWVVRRRAQALYRRFGFVDEGRLSGQSRKSYGYDDEVIMSKWLQGDRGAAAP